MTTTDPVFWNNPKAVVCPRCNGFGHTYPSHRRCTKCGGSGYMLEKPA